MSSPPRLRVIGLVVGGSVLALAAGFFFLTRGQSSSTAAAHAVIPLSKRPNQPATTKPKPAAKPRVAARKLSGRKAKSAPKRVLKQVPKPALPPVDGVPGSIAAALAHNRVVVVALYAPKIEPLFSSRASPIRKRSPRPRGMRACDRAAVERRHRAGQRDPRAG